MISPITTAEYRSEPSRDLYNIIYILIYVGYSHKLAIKYERYRKCERAQYFSF